MRAPPRLLLDLHEYSDTKVKGLASGSWMLKRR